ncbi:cytidylyltransferase [Achlya hypogyna]|uniref:Phosphatidate cytidylyltransferase n=1 Tax=Achlya hypogyna TaxID=1202772 RepID=A0A1V9Z3T3_ACHHY|nr:cytidylyltransferase [Achlya hypogyna]
MPTAPEGQYEHIVRGQLTADVEDELHQVEHAQLKTHGVTFVATPPASSLKLVAFIQTSNVAQRVISGVVLGSAVTVYLALGPKSAPIYLCSFVVSIANYEYAWLAHRIAHRFTSAVAEDCLDGCAVRPLDTISSAVTPIACGYPRLMAGFLASVVSASCTLATLYLNSHAWHYRDSYSTAPDGSHVPYVVIDLFLFVIFSTWLTVFCALLTPTAACMRNVVMQQLAYCLVTVTHYFCGTYDNACYVPIETSHGRWLAIVLILFNRLPLFRRVAPEVAVDSFVRIILDTIGFSYIVLLMQPIADLLLEVDGAPRIALGFLAVVWGTDTGAYIMGHVLKHMQYPRLHSLAKHISPNKDIEGSLGGVALGVGAIILVDALMELPVDLTPEIVKLQRIHRLLFAVVGGLLSRYGDLFASLLKRLAGVKDTGTLIPGHGGLLDRIDAMLFVGAVFALYHRCAFAPYYDRLMDAHYDNNLAEVASMYSRLTSAGIPMINSTFPAS